MDEQEKENFAFIKEKIKEKPMNKKRMLKYGIYTAALAVIFGLVACFVFTYMRPVMEEWLNPKKDAAITFPEDELATETEDSEIKEEETETEIQEETETVVKKELELSDFQQLQNKMYAIGKKANGSIVTVTGVISDLDWYNNAYESKGQGSGIIIGDNGNELLILTEHKIIAEAEEISVTFMNETTVTAVLKTYDGNTGLAMLSVDFSQLDDGTKNSISYAKFGNSLSITQGNLVIAIGSPLGTNYSIVAGNITSVGNTIHTIDNTYSVFTTDIIGSSSSGGALLNLNGEIVGLVMQDYSSEGEQNTLTAISISDLKKLIEMLSNGKSIPYLGLRVITVTDKIAGDYDIPQGVYIKEVLLDSPAWEAGLQSGDVIVEMDGEEIISVEAYETKVLNMQPGDVVNITVKRQGMDGYTRIACMVTAGQLK